VRVKSISWVAQLFFVLLATGATAAGPATPPLHKQMINDPFLKKDAYSVMVPDQWKAIGEITWRPGRPAPDVHIAVNSPDNTVGYQQLPILQYQANVRENRDFLFPAQRASNAEKFAEGQVVGYQALENTSRACLGERVFDEDSDSRVFSCDG
jgi:hypothetical protein